MAEIMLGGGEPELPPLDHGAGLARKLQTLGFCSNAGFGRAPLSPEAIRAWDLGSHAYLTPQDFDDLLQLSRVYCGAAAEFDGHDGPPPWEPELTREEQEKAAKQMEAQFDASFGVAG